MKKRAIVIVLDSVGIGAQNDAAHFGDSGAHTLAHIYESTKGLCLPNLYSLGLANIEGSRLPFCTDNATGAFGRAIEAGCAKDTICGHWELMGVISKLGFRTYPDGFPAELVSDFEKLIGRKSLGGMPASGTEIIAELGDEHVKTGFPIIYTSSDSVFQIAAHENIIPLDELYDICKKTRRLLNEKYPTGRVIARPFTGASGKYTRTENRRDYTVEPPSQTILDALTEQGFSVAAVGKIEDIFCNRGISYSTHTKNNASGIDETVRLVSSGEHDLIFTNLVDFDMLYGHRNDPIGYRGALEYFDKRLPEIISAMRKTDMLIITADHGCDPTHEGTNHTREHIPVLVYGKKLRGNINLCTRKSFADIGATAYEYITGKQFACGSSFLKLIKAY